MQNTRTQAHRVRIKTIKIINIHEHNSERTGFRGWKEMVARLHFGSRRNEAATQQQGQQKQTHHKTSN